MNIKELKEEYPMFPEIKEEYSNTVDGKVVILSTLLRKEFDNVWYISRIMRMFYVQPVVRNDQQRVTLLKLFFKQVYDYLIMGIYVEVTDKGGDTMYVKDDDQSSEKDRLLNLIL